ncbi:MAG: sodium:solute symporter family transporter [Burkholderiaceae bacterium]
MLFDTLDWLIPGLYLALMVWIALFSAVRTRSAEALFLGGRSLGFAVVGLSLFASNISSTTLVGLAGAAYTSGISVANYEWMAGVVLILAAIFLVPVYLRNRLRTVPEYFEDRFSRGTRRYVSGWMIVLSILVDTAASLYAGALVLQVFLPGLPMWPTVIALGVFAGVYTTLGGLRAVMLTDVLQALVLLFGSLVLAIAVFAEFKFDWGAMTANLPADHLSLIRPADDPQMPWTGLLVGVPILGLYYWGMNHYISQRFFAARNEDHARWGALLAALLKLTPLFIMVLPGAAALALLPNLDHADQVYPTLVREYLPVGLRGLVLTALLAAIMSTIDSTLNAASALLHYDFLHPSRHPQEGPASLAHARLLTLGLMAVAIAWAPVIASFPGLFSYLQQMFAIAVPPIAVVMVVGLLWAGMTSASAWATLGLGHLLGVTFAVLERQQLWDWHFLETAGLVSGICLCLAVITSVVSHSFQGRGHRPQASDWTVRWNPSMLGMAKPYPWFKHYLFWSMIFVGLTTALLVQFA